MKLIAPSYYPRFACIQGACRHSCCIGWEIDVDPDTLKRYQQVPGEAGARLRAGIDAENGCFRLDRDERCPFLNKAGLCDIIIDLGEENLCQICADHPRFRNFYADRTEIGLGLCCEAAARLILSEKEPLRLITLEDDKEEEPADPDEEALLAVRDKLMQAAPPVLPDAELLAWADYLTTLERLDDAWLAALTMLHQPARHTDDSAWDTHFQRLYEYLVYRHIPGALDDGNLSGRIAFVGLMVQLLRAIFSRQEVCTFDGLCELARLYSSEIEYSDENIDAILDGFK